MLHNVQITTHDMINMINGAKTGAISDIRTCQLLESDGLMWFTGNANNPQWSWDTNVLSTMTMKELINIYTRYCYRGV